MNMSGVKKKVSELDILREENRLMQGTVQAYANSIKMWEQRLKDARKEVEDLINTVQESMQESRNYMNREVNLVRSYFIESYSELEGKYRRGFNAILAEARTRIEVVQKLHPQKPPTTKRSKRG